MDDYSTELAAKIYYGVSWLTHHELTLGSKYLLQKSIVVFAALRVELPARWPVPPPLREILI